MVKAKTEKERPRWLSTLFPIHGLGWVVLSIVVGLVVALPVSVWLWLRDPANDVLDALSDFLDIDAKVWHIVLAISLATIAVGAFDAWYKRQPSLPTQAPRSKKPAYPTEIDYLGVKWPVSLVEYINSPLSTYFKVGKPVCLKCRTPLGLVVNAGEEDEGDEVISLSDDLADVLGSVRLVFKCSTDEARYDLREHGQSMYDARAFVNDRAMGLYRTAVAARESE